MKKSVVYILLVCLMLVGCGKKRPQHVFTHEVLLPMTPVKNQGKSELCWAYAMLATIETEHIVRGDSVNLSAVYIGRMLDDYAASVLQQRQSKQGAGVQAKRKGQRAMGVTLLNMLPTVGAMDYEVLPDDAPDDLATPSWVFLLGARYTPQEFARSVCAPGEYLQLMCDDDKPYYEESELEVPDNWLHDRYLNIPMDSLFAKTERAVREHHGVCWEDKGHAMAIVGIAHDDQGEKYFVMKNSWGTNRPHGGLEYISFKQFKKHTVAVEMTKEAYK